MFFVCLFALGSWFATIGLLIGYFLSSRQNFLDKIFCKIGTFLVTLPWLLPKKPMRGVKTVVGLIFLSKNVKKIGQKIKEGSSLASGITTKREWIQEPAYFETII